MTDSTPLCTLPPELIAHVGQLLTDADITFLVAESAPGQVTVLVDTADEERARAVIRLVLPHVLEGTDHAFHLSQRLVRSGRPDEPPGAADDPVSPELDELADDFVPQTPPPLPKPRDGVSRFAWTAVVAGPGVLLLPSLLPLPVMLAPMGMALFIAGFVTLVARMPDRPRQDDGWDDGAVL